MKSLNQNIEAYKAALQLGDLQQTYRSILKYISSLKSYFKSKYPEFLTSSHLYQGYLDVSFFTISPAFLKSKRLKIAIVFIHDQASFEVWLCGANKQIQQKYISIAKEEGWKKYPISAMKVGVYSILEHTLVAQPNFDDLESLTTYLEQELLVFVNTLEIYF